MYHKESAELMNAFEQEVQVHVEVSQLEDVFNHTELYFCAELWFSEDSDTTRFQVADMSCVSSRQMRINFSPTRGLNYHFPVFFDYVHLCAVEVTIHGYLTSLSPGLSRLSSTPTTVANTAHADSLSKQSWASVLFSSRNSSSRRHCAVSLHRHLCQALLSARERMLTFWHEISIFLSDNFASKPGLEISDFRSVLEHLTDNFQALISEDAMIAQVAQDINTLSSENACIFSQICDFVTSTPKVTKHLQKKSHQIRLKRFAEAFFCQELSLAHVMALYDPYVVGHEKVADVVRQSAYFQRLPDLPVSCRELDGDPQTMPIIFEDVFLAALTPQPPPPPPPGTCTKSLSVEEFVRLDEKPRATPTTPAAPSSSTASVRTSPSGRQDMRESSVGACVTASTTSAGPSGSCERQGGGLENGEASSGERAPQSAALEGTPPLAPSTSTTTPGKPYPLPFLRSITRPASHARRRQQLLSRRRSRGFMSTSLGDRDVILLGYRRVNDEFGGVVTPTSSTSPPRTSEGANCTSLANGVGGAVLSRHESASSLVSLPAIERDLGLAPSRFTYFRRQLHHTKSLPSLAAPLTSTNEAGAMAVTALGSLRLPEDAASALSIPWCPRCGLPDWSFSRQRDHGGVSGGHPLAISMPSLPSSNSFDLEDVGSELSPQSDSGIQKRRLFRPSLHRLKLLKSSAPSWLTRITSPSKHRRSASAAVYTEEIVRIGSCSNLAVDGVASCQCGIKRGEDRKTRNRSPDDGVHQAISRWNDTLSTSRFASEMVNPSDHLSAGTESGWNLDNHRTPSRRSKARPPRPILHSKDVITVTEPAIEVAQRCRLEVTDFRQPRVKTQAQSQDGMEMEDLLELADWMLVDPEEHLSPLERRLHRRSFSSTCVRDPPVIPETAVSPVVNGPNPLQLDTNESAGGGGALPVSKSSDRLVDAFAPGTMTFVVWKEHLKRELAPLYGGNVYSDFSQLAAPLPFFTKPSSNSADVHLIVCVHGLDGTSSDLRLVAMYLQLALPDACLEFLMSESNHEDTFANLDVLRDNLVDEIINHVDRMDDQPSHISFIGHSLGCVLIRAALAHPRMDPLLPLMHTFLSLCGPHLGTVYGTSGLVNMGMWALQKLKKSDSLAQLRLRDHTDPRETYIYKLSSSPGLGSFRYVLLVSSPQDHYVPHHSARIELCKAAIQDTSEFGIIYMEMVANLLQRLIKESRTTVVRYDIHHNFPSSANNFIGRAAHIAVLDSEVLLEKFFCVSAAKWKADFMLDKLAYEMSVAQARLSNVLTSAPTTHTAASPFRGLSLNLGYTQTCRR
ncbi:hypothetical protein AAHC03_017243 [Spirometra sp. Aus1]